MSGATATLIDDGEGKAVLTSEDWTHQWRDADGVFRESEGGAQWFFQRRVDAIAFAARRGITITEAP